jgi:hypothetical protein
MKKTSTGFVSTCLKIWMATWITVSFTAATVFAQLPDTAKPGPQVPTNSMMAGSPVTPYTAGVMGYMILIGILVSVLLIGGFLFINIGLLSKRGENETRHREPSDVDLLTHRLWPNENRVHPVLPAEEDLDQTVQDISIHPKHNFNEMDLVQEDQMRQPGYARKNRDENAA